MLRQKRGSLYSRYTSQLVTHIRRVGELYKPLQYRIVHFTKRRADYIDARVVVNLLLAIIERTQISLLSYLLKHQQTDNA